MDKLYIVIPAYNEEANIRQVVDDWYPIVEQVEKIRGGVDQGSSSLTMAARTPPIPS